MENEEKVRYSMQWNNTFKEIRTNWKSFSNEINKEWKEQVKDDRSPLQRILKYIQDPSTLPDPYRSDIKSAISNARNISDNSYASVKKIIGKLY